MVTIYCRLHDIDVSPETNAGRGPVDFKFSRGWNARALVEIKPMDNPRFKHGVSTQLPTYQVAEQIANGYFVAIAFTDLEMDEARLRDLKRLAKGAGDSLGFRVKVVRIDARPKQSASKA